MSIAHDRIQQLTLASKRIATIVSYRFMSCNVDIPSTRICADRLHKLQDKSSLNKKAFMAVDDKYTLVQIAKSEN